MPDYSVSAEMAAALRKAGTCLSFDPSSIADPAVAQALGDIINVLNLQLPRAIDQVINGGAGGGVDGALCDEIWLRAIAKGGAVPAHLLAGMGNRAATALHVHINEFGGPGVAVPDSAVLATAPAGASLEVLTGALMDPTRHWWRQTRGYAARAFTCTDPILYDLPTDAVSHGPILVTTSKAEYGWTGKMWARPRLTAEGHVDVPVEADFDATAPAFTATAPIHYAANVVSHDAVGVTATTPYSFSGKVLETLNLTAEGHVKTPAEADFVAMGAALPLAVKIAAVGTLTGDTLTSCAAGAGVYDNNGGAHWPVVDLGNGCPHVDDVYPCIGFDGTNYFIATVLARLAGTT